MNISKNKKGFSFLLSLAPIAYLINSLAHKFPEITQSVYASKIYPIISKISYYFINFIPFSVVEVLLILLITIILVFLGYSLFNLFKGRFQVFKKTLCDFVKIGICIASIMYFVFVTTCGINYARPSYITLIGYDQRQFTKEELAELCYYLVEQSNVSRANIDNIASTQINYSDKAIEVYAEYSNPNNIIIGGANRAKPVLFSRAMSYANITGVYVPFTFESNYNNDVLEHTIPSTILHEIAHYKGFMREQDANFIAYVVGASSSAPDFIYSSNVMALNYCLNAYYKVATSEEYAQLFSEISPDVISDMRSNSEYWDQFNTPVAEVSEKINDTYLKHNQQTSGTKSYGEMIDSLLIYYHEDIKK